MVGHVELRDDFKEQAEWRREKADSIRMTSATSKQPLSLIAGRNGRCYSARRFHSILLTRGGRWPTGRGTMDRGATRCRLWLVTGNRRRLRPIFYRGSDDAAWITCTPPPAEDMNDACFIVCNKNGQALGYFYFEDDRGATGCC
jgi:hypothetical protein